MRFLFIIVALAACSSAKVFEEQMPLQEANNVDNSTVDATAITGIPENGWSCSNSNFVYTQKDVEKALTAALAIASRRDRKKCIAGEPGKDYPKYFGNKENLSFSCPDPGRVGYCEFPLDRNTHWREGQSARKDRAVFTMDQNDDATFCGVVQHVRDEKKKRNYFGLCNSQSRNLPPDNDPRR